MDPTRNARILIIDDHQLVLEGLKLLIESTSELDFVGMAESGKVGISMIEETKPDILLLDIEMPEMNGIEVCKHVKASFPSIKVIAITMLVQPSIIQSMRSAGADGFLIKNTSGAELVFAIKEVYEGRSYYSSEVLEKVKKGIIINGNKFPVPKLSKREKEVVSLIMESYNTKEIAKALSISAGTVETHRRNLFRKLGVKNAVGLVKTVMDHRLL